jgi:hypothetical protein
VIDRRLNGKNKSAVNRQRFIKRFKNQIKRAVSDAISGRSISDIEQGENVRIPKRDISEPTFHHSNEGMRERIHPGNKEFVTGDRIKRPQGGGQGQGNQASDNGEGDDDFIFEISREEFLEFFFEDLELPKLIKTKLTKIQSEKFVRAGHTSVGVPTNINIVRSMKGALARRIALQTPYKRLLKHKLTELEEAKKQDPQDRVLIKQLEEEIAKFERKIRAIPFIDEFDLRYNNRIKQPKPTTQAVMFCIMDVSGSMDQEKKDVAKRFFMLLYLFLSRNYEKIDIVFIRHHTVAKEVDENDFFYSRETGGTVVSSALELTKEIINKRYPSSDWNIYAAQASDGDNWNDDSPICGNLLASSILPVVQYFAYIEITQDNHQNLWHEYQKVRKQFDNFAMKRIESAADIYPVFRKLFKKQAS